MKTIQELASAGGKARAKKLSAERRKEIAKLGGMASAAKTKRKRKTKP